MDVNKLKDNLKALIEEIDYDTDRISKFSDNTSEFEREDGEFWLNLGYQDLIAFWLDNRTKIKFCIICDDTVFDTDIIEVYGANYPVVDLPKED